MPMFSAPPDPVLTFANQEISRSQLVEILEAPRSASLRFESCVFDGEDLSELDLRGAEFENCRLVETRLRHAQLSRTRWIRSQGGRASFDFADLTDAQFEHGDFNNSSWTGAKLSGASLSDLKLTGARLTEIRALGWTLRDSLLVSADIRGLSFRKQAVERLNMAGADLAGCDFRDAVLLDCDLSNANLKGAKFAGADLRQAQLGDAHANDLLQHFKGSTISSAQAAQLVATLGVQVI